MASVKKNDSGKPQLAANHAALKADLIHRALETGGIGIWQCDLQRRTLVISDSLLRYLRLPEINFPQTFESVIAYVHPEDREWLREIACSLQHGRTHLEVEFRALIHGQIRWLLVKGYMVNSDDQQQRAMMGIAYDMTSRKHIEQALLKSEAHLHLITSQMPAILWTTDLRLRFTSSMGAGLASLGLEQGQIIGVSLYDYFHTMDPDYPPIAAHQEALSGRNAIYDFEWNGSVFQNYIEPLRDADDQIIGTIGAALDITERKRHEDILLKVAQGISTDISGDFFESLVKHLADALSSDYAFVARTLPEEQGYIRTITLCAGTEVIDNVQYNLAGTPCENVVGKKICSYPSGVRRFFPQDLMLIELEIEGFVGVPLFASDGKSLGLIAVMYKRPLKNEDLVVSLLQIFAARASAELERHRNQQSLEYQASHDSLTNLPNRNWLIRRVNETITDKDQDKRPFALMMMDLDHFKEINDTLGHQVGDHLLKEIAQRLDSVTASFNARITRLGGDEFAILLRPPITDAIVNCVAEAILTALKEPFDLDTLSLEIGASIGIALSPAHGEDALTLMRCADVAMYTAKRGGSGFAVYRPEEDEHTPRRLSLMTELRTAIREHQLLLHFQPKISLKEKRLIGFEALVRWAHPQHGLIPPDHFIPLAEMGQLIRPTAVWVLDNALAQWRRWFDQGLQTRIAVNLSAHNLMDEDCPRHIDQLLRYYRVPPGHLEIEITESALIADPIHALDILKRINELNVLLLIDDYGTGYSSLAYLKRLPVNTLKIDMSFVNQMTHSQPDAMIVKSTVNLAHNLGLSVTAEGVEDRATLNALRLIHCDQVQGFYIGSPMNSVQVSRWLERTPWAVHPSRLPNN